MEFKKLFTDDSAVSPVIGVILMVAITVILAAVIGTFVLNLGGSIQNTAPQASFSFDYSGDNVTITHQTGDTITADQLNTTGENWNSSQSDVWTDAGSSITAGDSITKVSDDGFSGETIRVVWESQTGDNSATLSQSTAPGA